MRNAPATSATAIRFILELLKMPVSKAVPFSLRASKAATTSISEKATSPIDWPVLTLPKWFFPVAISARLTTAMNSPTRPQVIITPLVRIDSPRGRGWRVIKPGVCSSKPSATPNGALTRKLIHRICAGVNGWPAARSNRLAPRKVRTKATSSSRTKRMYLLRLS